MQIEVTENWSGRKFSLAWPWVYEREFVVTGAKTAEEALTAPGIPQRDEASDYSRRLRCPGPQVKECKGPFFWVVTAPYAVSEQCNFFDPGIEPGDEGADIEWQTIETAESVDYDLDNRPLLNSAAKPLQVMSRPITYKRLTIVKNMPFYDINLSNTYENAVNSAQVDLGRGVIIQPEHMRCCVIEPAIRYKQTAQNLPMRFIFDIIATNVLGSYPFQYRTMDAGTEGWYQDTDKFDAKFSNGRGQVLDTPVRLNGAGLPLPYTNPKTNVGEASQTAVAPPVAPTRYQVEYYDKDGKKQAAYAAASTASVFLYFKRCRVVDFAPLLALL